MSREKSYFVVGLVTGVVITVLFLQYFAPRYSTVRTGETILKQDRWTGQSWRYADDQWKAIVGRDHDWEKIDGTLRDALQVPFANVDNAAALKLLREGHPALKDLSDDDLLERIKVVYSKQILCNLYLDSFLKARQAEKGKEGEK